MSECNRPMVTHHAGCECHEARRDAEIARLKAALARVTAQRDKLAHDYHAELWAQCAGKTMADRYMESEHGLRIENGEVKDIEG